LAEIVGPHKIQLTDKKGDKEIVTAKYILIATGGRPTFLDGIKDV